MLRKTLLLFATAALPFLGQSMPLVSETQRMFKHAAFERSEATTNIPFAVVNANDTGSYIPPPTKPLPPGSGLVSPRDAKPAVWYTYWDTSQLCKGDTCRSASDGYMQVVQLDGDGFTLGGSVQVGVYRTADSSIIWGARVTARQNNGFRDGSWGAQTNVLDCLLQPGPHPPTQAFIAGYDDETGAWSDSTDIGGVGCLY